MFIFRVGVYNDEIDKKLKFKDGVEQPAIKSTVIAETPSKAKYQFYKYLQDGIWECDFETFLKYAWVEKIRIAGIHHLFGDYEQFARVIDYRGIPLAFQGMKVEVCGKLGRIVGSNSSSNLNIVFDGNWHKNNCHPRHEMVYYDNHGNIVYDFRAEKKVV